MPEKLHPENEPRADWAENAVNTFGVETYAGRTFTQTVKEQPEEGDDAYTMIQDLIGDMLHLAVRHRWDPDEILERAKSNFDHENHPDYEGD
jgi:hypothetical protein